MHGVEHLFATPGFDSRLGNGLWAKLISIISSPPPLVISDLSINAG